MAATDKVRSSIAEEAAEWFVANRGGLMDAIQQGQFVAWLKSSPLHIEEYLGTALLARDLRQATADPETPVEALVTRTRSPDDAAARTLSTGTHESALRYSRKAWRLITLHVAGAAALLAAVALTFFWWTGDRATALRYGTHHGEQVTQRLPDNSLLRLDTDTSVTVRTDRSQRLVEVEHGQVLFEVAHAARPFRVLAGFAEMRAVGTKVNVYRKSDSTTVTVVEGEATVRLAPGLPGSAAAAGRVVSVQAGEQVRVGRGTLPATAAPADAQRNTAWLRRQIVFEQEPLETVIAEFNRYSATPIEIATPELRTLKISGTLSTDDIESLISFLRSLEGVSVEVTRTRIRVSRK